MKDLSEVLDLDLHLPIRGKVYVVHPPSAANGANLMNRLAFGVAADAGIPLDEAQRRALIVDDEDMPDFATQCLGPVHDEMVADGLSQAEVEFAVSTAFFAWTVGKEYAEHYWETAGNLERPTDKPGRPTATPTRSAAESTTPTSASPSGTTASSSHPGPEAAPSSSSGEATATS